MVWVIANAIIISNSYFAGQLEDGMYAERPVQCLAHSRHLVNGSYFPYVLWLSNFPCGFQFYVPRTNWGRLSSSGDRLVWISQVGQQRNWQFNWSVGQRPTPLTLRETSWPETRSTGLKGRPPSLKILKRNNDPIQLLRIYGTSLFLVHLLPPRLQILLWLLGFCDLVNRDRGSDQNIDPFLWHKWLLLFWKTLKFGLKRGSGTHWNFPYSCPN